MKTIVKVNNIREVQMKGKDGNPFVAWRIYSNNCIINVSTHCEGYQLLGKVAKGDQVFVDYYTTEKNGATYKNANQIRLVEGMSDLELVNVQIQLINDKLDQLLEKQKSSSLQNKVDAIVDKFEATQKGFGINL